MWERGHISIDEVWGAYTRYVYLDRLKDAATLCATAEAAPASISWATEGMAVAESFDTETGRYVGLVAGAHAPSVRGSTLLVRADLAERQLAIDAAERREGVDDEPRERDENGLSIVAGHDSDRSESAHVAAPREPQRFYAVIVVDPTRLPMEAARINTEVLSHLNALDGAEMEITIEVRATRKEGFPDETVRIVTENAAALRFEDHGFAPN